jgi:hypothetical protein
MVAFRIGRQPVVRFRCPGSRAPAGHPVRAVAFGSLRLWPRHRGGQHQRTGRPAPSRDLRGTDAPHVPPRR